MRPSLYLATLLAASLACGLGARAGEAALTKPNPVLRQLVEAMPRDATQEIRVMTATFQPGSRTVRHSHRFPVTVYILEGTFTLELKGQPPLVVKAGEAYVEPPNVEMTGYNRSTTEPAKVVIFYVSGRDTPFLDPVE
jgi:quercetin dioxygenase-like cupin family protein